MNFINKSTLIIAVIITAAGILHSQSEGVRVGVVQSIDKKAGVITVSSPTAGTDIKLGDLLYVRIDGKIVQLRATFPMMTISKCKAEGKNQALWTKVEKGISVYRFKNEVDENGDSGKGQTNIRQATGYAKIVDGDRALARDRALDDAKSKLVEQFVGSNISSKSVIENYYLVSNIVNSYSSNLVKNIMIIKQWEESEGYFVTLEGDVEEANVVNAIQDALKRYGMPKLMVLVDEIISVEGIKKKNSPGMTSTEFNIMEIMGNSGFAFVAPEITQELMKKEKSKMQKAFSGKISEDVQDLLLYDGSTAADVIIYGTVVVRDQRNATKDMSSKNKFKEANINLKAVDVYTGKVIAEVVDNASGNHIDEETATNDAIHKCLSNSKIFGTKKDNDNFDPGGLMKTGDFMKSIIKGVVKAANNREISIFITGLEPKDIKHFTDQLSKRVRGVSSVLEKGRDGKAVRIVVYFSSYTSDLADELSAKSDKMGYKINTIQSKTNKIVMTVKKLE